MSKKQKQKHNENMTDNIEEIDLANHEAEKFITIFDKAFGGNHEKNENENLDSEDGIKGFFDIVVKNIQKLNHNELKNTNK